MLDAKSTRVNYSARRRSILRGALAAAMLTAFGLAGAPAHAEGPVVKAEIKPFEQTVPSSDKNAAITFKMIPIPGGVFKMGSPESENGRDAAEGPQATVQVEPFFMEEHETTWAEYGEFLKNYHLLSERGPVVSVPVDKMADAVTYPTPLYELEAGPILESMGRGSDYPAVIMSQFAARQYTKWLSKKTGRFYRLPTEAEWEYACRAGTTTAYNFGDDAEKLGENAIYFDNAATKAAADGAYRKVKQFKPNAWGLYDMHGNVAEWCIDEYDADWYKKLAEKGGTIKAADAVRWPNSKTQYPRVIRGGGWESEAGDLRSARRIESKPEMNNRDPQLPRSPYWMSNGFWIGFRVVSPVNAPPASEWNKYWDADDAFTKDTIMRDRDRHELFPSADAAATPTAGK